MSSESFSDAALILLGHGSTQNDAAGAPVFQHAAELRRRNLFASVYEAFWKQAPQIKQVLPRIQARRVLIVPLFISEGYFSSQIIPCELGRVPDSILNPQPSTLSYCKPVGTHPGMTDILLDRASEVVEKFPFPRLPRTENTTLFIAGHGTEQNEDSRGAIEQHVDLIRQRGTYAAVHGVFLEEAPRIGKCYELAQTRYLVVVPFFISEGDHTQVDIPVLLGESRRVAEERLSAGQFPWRNPTQRKDKFIWYADVVGTAPQVADIILERVQEAASNQ